MTPQDTAAVLQGGETPALEYDNVIEETITPEEYGATAEQTKANKVIDVDFKVKEAIKKKPLFYRFIKRAFDIVFSLMVIIITFIPLLIISMFIAIETKTFPIYSQVRIGHKGPFRFYKLRSMVSDSDDVQKYFSPEQLEQWNKEHKVDADPRVTKLGVFLRKTSLDELPQFFNVTAGQMSVIGPRCITESELAWYGQNVDLLLSVPQGITGAWQIGERNNATFENGTRQAIELDYCHSASLNLDAKIFLATFAAMFVKRTGQ